MEISKHRYLSLDLIRASAIILMIIFHLCFNLNHFKFIDINIYHSAFWHYFRYVIVTIFLLCVGISLFLSNQNGIKIVKSLKRFLLLFGASSAITAVTYFIFPNSWIYFGILHFIAFASLSGLLFVSRPFIALLIGLVIVIGWNVGFINMHWLFEISRQTLSLPIRTEDLVPLTPWFGVVLIGIFLGSKRAFDFPVKETTLTKKVAFLGRHSLLIYIVHQPIMFGSIFLAYKLIN